MLVGLFTFALHLAIGDEPTNPVDIMAAMASRDTGCITVTDVYRVDEPTPHVQFHVLSDPPSGAVLQWIAASSVLAGGRQQENYGHPRHPEVSLSFRVLADDQPQYDEVRANRDTIVSCFQSVV
jgi:hypothetical protein